MEITVQCMCGSTVTFKDTPVEGKLKYPFYCTSCGADCTQRANAFIQAQLAAETEKKKSKRGRSWLRPFGRRVEESAETEVASECASGEAATATNFRSSDQEATDSGDEASAIRIVVAAGAALLVGTLGAIGWLLIAQSTGLQIGYVAWALGGLVGLTSRLVTPRGHVLLGHVAVLAAIVAIGGGQYLVSRWAIQSAVHECAPAAYNEIIAFAKEAAAAETSEEMREKTAKFNLVHAVAGRQETNAIAAYQKFQIADSALTGMGIVERGKDAKLTLDEQANRAEEESVTLADMARFNAEVTPAMRELVAGHPSAEEYAASFEQQVNSHISISTVVFYSFNRYTLLWLVLGTGTAYRLARNPGLNY